ncbi:MAG: hypothetical protein AB1779_00695 [Candidatus Thermoplasmatota archaeon]
MNANIRIGKSPDCRRLEQNSKSTGFFPEERRRKMIIQPNESIDELEFVYEIVI